MRDFTLEWVRFKEFQVKVGQFKRCFTFENPMNPWDVGLGNYSQLSGRMTALVDEDCSGEPGQNGRDLGLQFQGDLFPVGKDKHRLIRYQAAVYNGNGQNNNSGETEIIYDVNDRTDQAYYEELYSNAKIGIYNRFFKI